MKYERSQDASRGSDVTLLWKSFAAHRKLLATWSGQSADRSVAGDKKYVLRDKRFET